MRQQTTVDPIILSIYLFLAHNNGCELSSQGTDHSISNRRASLVRSSETLGADTQATWIENDAVWDLKVLLRIRKAYLVEYWQNESQVQAL
jgi:hypothetical protein